ncbi:MAG: toll/interleukin-1 receptor domain-containing protein, partial [bacterium]
NVVKHPYRVFISYSHQDRELATRLEAHLRSKGLFPITDHEIRVGEAFSEEIREMIECAHVFMPLVTPSANERLWVQQEIGYATALHVPVCPVAVGNLPSGMAEHIQGIHIADVGGKSLADDDVMAIVSDRLTYEMIDDLVRRARRRPRQGRYDCALYWTDRQELLVTLTEAAYRGGCKLIKNRAKSEHVNRGAWRLRQCTAFGSFSIPDAGVNSELWETRDKDRYRSQHERRLLRRERQAMEAYTTCFGCDLIMDPRIDVKKLTAAAPTWAGSAAGVTGKAEMKIRSAHADHKTVFKHAASRTALRVRLIIDFIRDHKDDDCVRVVIPATPGQITTNLIIVGDWFAAEAVVPLYHSGGYERTMFTRHAPTVLNTIDRFNQDFEDHLRGAGFDPGQPSTIRKAKQAALDMLHHWYKELQALATVQSDSVPVRQQLLPARDAGARSSPRN